MDKGVMLLGLPSRCAKLYAEVQSGECYVELVLDQHRSWLTNISPNSLGQRLVFAGL